jgi:hypothetical protein
MVFAESGQIIKPPSKFLGTFGWTSSFIGSTLEHCDELLRGKALSMAYESPHCPIAGALARRALKVTRGVSPRFVDDGYHGYVPRDESAIPDFAPSNDTRDLFFELYGIDPPTQIEIERRISCGNYEIRDLVIPPADQQHYCSRYVEVG